MSIELKEARLGIEAAEAKARELGVPMVVAVVDPGGNLVALERMDDALLVSLTVAANKAYTAVALRMATAELGRLAQPGQPLFGLPEAAGGRMAIFGGGLPLWRDGALLGGVGVSGGSVEEDAACALAAQERLARG